MCLLLYLDLDMSRRTSDLHRHMSVQTLHSWAGASNSLACRLERLILHYQKERLESHVSGLGIPGVHGPLVMLYLNICRLS